jgi:hypothetical protein
MFYCVTQRDYLGPLSHFMSLAAYSDAEEKGEFRGDTPIPRHGDYRPPAPPLSRSYDLAGLTQILSIRNMPFGESSDVVGTTSLQVIPQQ